MSGIAIIATGIMLAVAFIVLPTWMVITAIADRRYAKRNGDI